MNAILNTLFVNYKTTLAGAALAAATYLCTAPGAWQIIGTIAIAALGALSHDPKAPDSK